MAVQDLITPRGWIKHDGGGRPVPIGTPVEVRMFNGDVQSFKAGGATFDLDGTPIAQERGRWSGWDYADGGPMAPKFKAYRLHVESDVSERNAAMFRSWLDVRENAQA